MANSASNQWVRYHITLAVLAVLVMMSGCTLRGADGGIDPDGPPVVNIIAPLAETSYAVGANINIQVAVSNAGEDIARVEIAMDGATLETIASPNPSGRAVFGIGRTIPAPAVGAHTIDVAAFRSDNSASSPQSVAFAVVDRSTVSIVRSEPEPTSTPTEVVQPTATESQAQPATDTEPTTAPEPTDVPASATPSVPTALSTANINVRSGPGLVFDPPIGAFREGDTAEILSLNSTGTWIKIRRGTTGEGWVLASLVEISGSTAGLPREVGPPTPIQATATPIATSTPTVTNNLVVINPYMDPPQPQCGQDFRAGITIRNDGSGNLSTGMTRIEIRRVSDSQVIRSSGDALVAVNLPPGGTHTVAFTFNVDVFVNEDQRVVFIADVNNQVAETIENDNQTGITYRLPSC
jgi:hypothetical protein